MVDIVLDHPQLPYPSLTFETGSSIDVCGGVGILFCLGMYSFEFIRQSLKVCRLNSTIKCTTLSWLILRYLLLGA